MSQRVSIDGKTFELFISESDINARIELMGMEISNSLKDRDWLTIGVLNGAFMFVSDLVRAFQYDVSLDFIRVKSYSGTDSTRKVREIMGLNEDISGKTVLVVDDILDTGHTLAYLRSRMLELGAAEVLFACMLFKPDALEADVQPDFVGFSIENRWVAGYGMDTNEKGRMYRDIYQLVN